LGEVPADVVGLSYGESRTLAREVAARAGPDVDPAAVIVDAPPRPSFRESGARVIHEGTVRRLDAVSRLVEALKAAERDQWRLGVYAPADRRDRVAAAAETVLGVPAYEGDPG
jgi:hypothetical protein